MIESEHDVWETGHSSTSLSAAMGMAAARDIKEEKSLCRTSYWGWGFTGGMALEALNHIGHEKKDMIVILNDNEMSIAPNVGALAFCTWEDYEQQENINGQKMSWKCS